MDLDLPLEIYTLDQALLFLQDKNKLFNDRNAVLQLAKEGKIGICFYVADIDKNFIRLDEEDNRWKVERCEPLLQTALERVVYPIDRVDQDNHWTAHTINPRKQQVFPILDSWSLQRFADRPDEETAPIMPWNLSAIDENNQLIKIAIVKSKAVNHCYLPKYAEWQKERGLNVITFDDDVQQEVTVTGGNSKYFKTWSTMEVKRSDLCVIKSVLDVYIKRVLAEQNKPERQEPKALKELTGKLKERMENLVAWLDKQPSAFDPHNHNLTKVQVWDACGLEEGMSEGTLSAFFQNSYISLLISFKSGNRQTQPIN